VCSFFSGTWIFEKASKSLTDGFCRSWLRRSRCCCCVEGETLAVGARGGS
jgi:hypothetical protein